MISDGAVLQRDPSITVSLHPLVLMSISDHFTRLRVANAAQQRPVGALLGEQKSRAVDISGR